MFDTQQVPAARRLPVVPGRGLFGHAAAFRADMLRTMADIAAQSRGVAGFKLGPQTAVVLSSPEAMHEVLIEKAADFDRGARIRRALEPALGQGLLVSEGELHARQRKLVLPKFTPRKVGRHADVIVGEARRRIGQWPDGAELDLLSETSALTMDIINRLLFGVPLDKDRQVAAAITTILEWEMRALTGIVPLPLSWPNARNRAMREAVRFLYDHVGRFIRQREGVPAGEHGDLLDELLSARYEDGSPMSREQLLHEAASIWGASQETSADAQAWALYVLGHYPEVRDRVRAEVDEVVGSRPIRFEDLAALPYTLKVWKETLRMFPPTSMLVRGTLRDTTLGGYRVRRGTPVYLAIHAMHHDREVFADPDRFDPSRFDKDNERLMHRQAFLPFGAGKHGCIGSHLAMMEGHLLLATFAQNVDVELTSPEPIEPTLVINLRPKGGVPARVRRRPTSEL